MSDPATVNNATPLHYHEYMGSKPINNYLIVPTVCRPCSESRAGALLEPAGTAFDDFIDQTKFHRFKRRQELVALDCG